MFDTFIHEKRIFSHNFTQSHMLHIVYIQVSLITLGFIFLFEGISCIKQLCVKVIVDMLQGMNLFYLNDYCDVTHR